MRRTISGRRLLRPGDHVLVACSGGPDSTALVHVLARLADELGITLLVGAIDHGLRPGSERDVEHVRRLADDLGLAFRATAVQVGSGPSIQAAARRARYEALGQMAAREGARRIAVGHTRDDQAETVLARVLRGAGLTGLGAMAPRRRDGVVRPLIDCKRGQVQQYLNQHRLRAVIDPSNADPAFERVRIRNSVLPMLGREDPRVVDHLADLADDARRATRALRGPARRLLRQAELPDGTLAGEALHHAPRAVRDEALALWIVGRTGRRPGRAAREALEAALGGRGEVRLSGGWRAHLAGGRLVIGRAPGHTRSTRDS